MTPRDEWRLPTRHLGQRILIFGSLHSTNDLAAELARDRANAGIAILADAQTAGRGQHGRTWTARPGSSVLLSLVLFPPPSLRRPAVLTAWAAVAVCETVRRVTGHPARIKWPNDILLKGRKVSGILIEQGNGTVVGIGLNVQQSVDEFAVAGLPAATSLAQHVAGPLDTAEIARTLLTVLDEEYHLCQAGDLATLESCWKWHVGLLGRRVLVECHDAIHQGRLVDMTFGGVELERSGDSPLLIAPEQVLHLHGQDWL